MSELPNGSPQPPPAPPRAAERLDDIIADFERVIVPGVTHWNHPAFYAYFSVSASAPGILGELLADKGDRAEHVAIHGRPDGFDVPALAGGHAAS